MSISNVSFGGVVVVSGKANKMSKVTRKFDIQARIGSVDMKDVTSYYKKSSSTGAIAKSAQKGDRIQLFVTGDDVAKVRAKQTGWKSLDDILSKMTSYFNLENVSISEAVEKIIRG